jgi:hypothetical protein
MLGDVQIAEPGALIGFTGQRVIEQTIRERCPTDSSARNICSITAWSTWSSIATNARDLVAPLASAHEAPRPKLRARRRRPAPIRRIRRRPN